MTEDVRRHLLEIPELAALLPDALVARGAIDGPRPAPASKPPVKLHILHLMDTRPRYDWEAGMAWCDPDSQGVLPYLWGWVRDLEASAYESSAILPAEAPETPTVSGCCGWLTAHLAILANLPQWDDFAHGVKSTHRLLLAAVRSVRDREEPVPCNRCGAGKLARDGETNRWACPACGHVVAIQAVTLRDASRIVGVPERTLREWATHPGLLSPVADGPRLRLFDLGDVRRVTAEKRLRDQA